MGKKIPKTDRNGTPLSPGDFVWVFSDHSKRPDSMAKVLYPGVEKSTITKEGRRNDEKADNQNLEVF